MTPETITSSANRRIQRLRALMRRSPLDGAALAVVEGPKLVREACRSGLEVEEVLVASSKLAAFREEDWSGTAGDELCGVSDSLFHSLSDTVTSQGILAVVRMPAAPLNPLLAGEPLLLVAHQVQDPGNLGTLARSAEAFGATALLLTARTVSPLNPKAVRASSGSLFRLPVAGPLAPGSLAQRLRRSRIRLVAAMPDGTTDFRQADYRGGLALVVGSEGGGIPPGLGAFDDEIRVPTAKGIDSLNVAAAAAIVLCEAARQRDCREDVPGLAQSTDPGQPL